jgi:DNA-binding NarL/FixJ family response regulator
VSQGVQPRPGLLVDSAQVRVLVCDDDDTFRAALYELLEIQGFTLVGSAAGGSEGVALAQQLEPDVILMDLRMPFVDGIEATRQITASRARVKVIMLSAYDDPALTRSAQESGVFSYLVKGCAPSLICDALLEAWQDGRS